MHSPFVSQNAITPDIENMNPHAQGPMWTQLPTHNISHPSTGQEGGGGQFSPKAPLTLGHPSTQTVPPQGGGGGERGVDAKETCPNNSFHNHGRGGGRSRRMGQRFGTPPLRRYWCQIVNLNSTYDQQVALITKARQKTFCVQHEQEWGSEDVGQNCFKFFSTLECALSKCYLLFSWPFCCTLSVSTILIFASCNVTGEMRPIAISQGHRG